MLSPASLWFAIPATHKPHRTPTASIKAHACCRCLSSRETLSLPRCLADSRSTSAGRRYGRYRLRWDVDASIANLRPSKRALGFSWRCCALELEYCWNMSLEAMSGKLTGPPPAHSPPPIPSLCFASAIHAAIAHSLTLTTSELWRARLKHSDPGWRSTPTPPRAQVPPGGYRRPRAREGGAARRRARRRAGI